MTFPALSGFPAARPGPSERQMGGVVAALLKLFAGRVPDQESCARVAELAMTPAQWTAAHAVFDEVRRRLLAAQTARDGVREGQHYFEESCCQALYNATCPRDPFDASAAFFVAPQALKLARLVGVSVDEVAAILAPMK